MKSETELLQIAEEKGWNYISQYEILPESFIRKHKDDIEWDDICAHQRMSESLIRDFQDKLCWRRISLYQTLTESFIREFQKKVHWAYINVHQILSESFIKEFKNRVNWGNISRCQSLSEQFIREFKDKLDLVLISFNQNISNEFRKELNLKSVHTWYNTSEEEKIKYIQEKSVFNIESDEDGKYILAYKTVRENYKSVHDRRVEYQIGKTVQVQRCNCNMETENSFGLSAWDEKNAFEYYPFGRLLLVKIYIRDIGAIVHRGRKIRCYKQTVVKELKNLSFSKEEII